MVVVIGTEVLTRNLFSFSFQVSDSLGGYLIVAIAFFSLAVGQGYQSFHRVEFLRMRLGERGRIASDLVFNGLALAFCAVLVWQFARVEIATYRSGNIDTTELMMPLWIPQMSMTLGAICATISVGASLVRGVVALAAGRAAR